MQPMNEKRLHRLKLVYGIALTFIALTLLSSSFLMQYAIKRNDGDSRVINLSGRQRMLSQRLTKCVLALEQPTSSDVRSQRVKELTESFVSWKAAHLGLQHGDVKLGLPQRENSPEIGALFAKMDPFYKAIVKELDRLLSAGKFDPAALHTTSEVMLTNESGFLTKMDQITFLFDKESKERIFSLQRLEIIFLIVGLLILAFEFLFIFRPTLSQLTLLLASLSSRWENLREANGELNDRLTLAVDSTGFGVWEWLVPENRLIWDKRMFTLYGIQEEDFTGAYYAWLNSVHPDDRERSDSGIKLALQGEKKIDDEFRVVWPSGEVRHLKVNAIVQRAADGKPLRIIGVNYDITERKQLEMDKELLVTNAFTETIRLQENKYRQNARDLAILTATIDAFWLVDMQGHFLEVNDRYCRMIGYSQQELLAMKIADVEAMESNADIATKIKRIKELGEIHFESRHQRKDGIIIDVEVSVQYIQFGGGQMVCFLRDITERKRSEGLAHEQAVLLELEVADRQLAQEHLAVKQLQLEALNNSLQERVSEALTELRQRDQMMISQSRQAAMGEMIGNIAHQWRQPLNALSMLLANIQMTHMYNEITADFMKNVLEKGNQLIQKMSTTISDFRNFFLPDKESVSFSANSQVNHALSLVEAELNSQNIKIHLEADSEMLLTGLPNEYSQVILNLLSNAREAIKENSIPEGIIKIRLFERDGFACADVSDNGGGIPVDVIDKIFEPYFSTKEMGTGIGLYMSKMIIERSMNGTIEARNIDSGAEFVVSIPLGETL